MAIRSQTEGNRPERFAAFIEASRFDPPRPLLTRAVGLARSKDRALDAGAGALNATKYLISAGFAHVTALDASPASQRVAAELPPDQVSFILTPFENFAFPDRSFDLVNAEFSLPFIRRGEFAAVFAALLGSVRPAGVFAGQLFGPNDSWNTPESSMNFHSHDEVVRLLGGFDIVELDEEDHPGTTKLGEPKHWHIFHIIARRQR